MRGAANNQQLWRQNFCSRGTPFQFSCVILTSPIHCSDNSWRDIFFGKHEHGALWLLICGAIEKHLLTYRFHSPGGGAGSRLWIWVFFCSKSLFKRSRMSEHFYAQHGFNITTLHISFGCKMTVLPYGVALLTTLSVLCLTTLILIGYLPVTWISLT